MNTAYLDDEPIKNINYLLEIPFFSLFVVPLRRFFETS